LGQLEYPEVLDQQVQLVLWDLQDYLVILVRWVLQDCLVLLDSKEYRDLLDKLDQRELQATVELQGIQEQPGYLDSKAFKVREAVNVCFLHDIVRSCKLLVHDSISCVLSSFSVIRL
jgi:hypothetical protein